MRRVWPHSFVEDTNLTVNISALRKQLGETPSGQQYIETVPKKGYRFAVPVTYVLPGPTDASQPASLANETARKAMAPAEIPSIRDGALSWKSTGETSWWRSKLVMLSLILVVLSGSVYFVYRSRTVSEPRSHPPRRLAVLPFQNLQTDANTDFLGFSLADAVITKLDYISELYVRPSSAIQKYRSQAIDIRNVAADWMSIRFLPELLSGMTMICELRVNSST
jgi:hypothetical protein